jgi:hypothetical protein
MSWFSIVELVAEILFIVLFGGVALLMLAAHIQYERKYWLATHTWLKNIKTFLKEDE